LFGGADEFIYLTVELFFLTHQNAAVLLSMFPSLVQKTDLLVFVRNFFLKLND
jgi:hypothetical protein